MNDSIKKEADKILKAKNPNIFGLRKDNFLDFISDHNNGTLSFCALLSFFLLYI